MLALLIDHYNRKRPAVGHILAAGRDVPGPDQVLSRLH
jgi:hypothetical protein